MKHAEFKKHLSNRLAIKEIEIKTLLRANRKILKKLVHKDNGFSIPALGLFKINQRENNDTVKELKNYDKSIYFKADAGLRNNILKSNDRVIKQYSPTSLEAENSLMVSNSAPIEPEKTKHSISTIHNSIVDFSGKATDNYLPVSTLNNQETHSDIMLYNNPGKNKKLTRETFLQEHKELYLQEKHPYFEWAVIAIFLIILVSGLFLINPSVEPANEFNSAPFEFSEITETIIHPVIETIEPAQKAKNSDTVSTNLLN